MTHFLLAACGFVLVIVAVGLVRILPAPTEANRMMAAQLFLAALWAILVGGLLWLGLRRWAQFLPEVPEGDIVVVTEAGARASATCGAHWSGRKPSFAVGQWRACRC
jgi:hypothetical protein